MKAKPNHPIFTTMKNQNQDQKTEISPKKLFSIQFNLHGFVLCLLLFGCSIAIGATLFSSFPENLLILTVDLPAPAASDHHDYSLVQHLPPTNAPNSFAANQTESPTSSHADNEGLLMKDAMASSVSSDPRERVPNAVNKTEKPNMNDKDLMMKDQVVSRIPNADSQTKKPGSSYTRADFMHDMDDKELIKKALTVSRIPSDPSKTVPKVAFMFLVKGPMHLTLLWERFFRGNQGLYSIYVHSPPSYNVTFPEDSVFHGRRIPSKEVQWGKFNMVEAERRLLASALLDLSNQRFILLSESCTPLFNFSTIYTYLINSKETFVEAYDQPGPVGRDRYSPRMKPVVKLSQWRKGSQWFQIDRSLALQVITDQKYFWAFKKYCRGSCYGDEHYLPTFVSIEFWKRNSNRTLTWVDWSRGGPHPGKFERPLVTVEFLERLRNNHTCKYNGEEGNICFLFARKFPPSSVIRLLLFAARVLKIQ